MDTTYTNPNPNATKTNTPALKPQDYADKLRQTLSDITFPAMKLDIITKKGSTQVEVSAGKSVTVGEALGPIQQDRFIDQADLLRQVSDAHRLNWPSA